LISFLEVCAFPPIRQKKANGWGTELVQIHTVRDLERKQAPILSEGWGVKSSRTASHA
jgi:hypothetical protein